jgi:hypothetical protein
VCGACGRIRRLATKNGIRNYCSALIARIIRGKLLYLPPPRRPWLELARSSHHSLDIVTPPAALLPIENHIGYRNLRHRRLTGSLKGNRPDQVVSIVNCLAPSDRISRHCLGIWFRLGPAGHCCGLLGHIFRGKQCPARRCAAPLPSYVATWGGREVFEGGCRVIGNLPIQHERKLTCGPGKALTDLAVIVNRREKEAAEDYCHRHRHRTERKPSTALAVGRDKKNENNSPGSKETQRGPPPQSLLLANRWRKSATGAAIEPKTSKNLPTGGFLPGRPGLRQHGQEHGARRLRGSEADSE